MSSLSGKPLNRNIIYWFLAAFLVFATGVFIYIMSARNPAQLAKAAKQQREAEEVQAQAKPTDRAAADAIAAMEKTATREAESEAARKEDERMRIAAQQGEMDELNRQRALKGLPPIGAAPGMPGGVSAQPYPHGKEVPFQRDVERNLDKTGAGDMAPAAGFGAEKYFESYETPRVPRQSPQATSVQQGGGKPPTAKNDSYKVVVPEYSPTDYLLSEGGQIRVVLLTGINSQLAGPIKAKVVTDVYDSLTGTRLLIPRGATLLGTYSNKVIPGQDALGVTFRRVIMADGRSVALPEAPVTNTQGQIGMPGDYHSNLLKAIGPAALVGIVGRMVEPSPDTVTNNYYGSAAGGSGQTVTQQVWPKISERMLDRYNGARPYFVVEPGEVFNLYVTADLSIPPYGEKAKLVTRNAQ